MSKADNCLIFNYYKLMKKMYENYEFRIKYTGNSFNVTTASKLAIHQVVKDLASNFCKFRGALN